MTVYRIVLRGNGANGANAPASSETSASLRENDGMDEKMNSLDQSEKLVGSSMSTSHPKVKVERPFNAQYQRQLHQKTVNLIAARSILNKKLSRAFSQRYKFSHKLLDLHYQLKQREQRHLAARTRLLSELQKQYKLNQTPERKKDLRIVKKLLHTFKQHLKANNMYDPKQKYIRSPRLSPISDDSQESEVQQNVITAMAEHIDLEEKANGTKRKRSESQRSTVSLASLFQEPEQAGKTADGKVQVSKKTKKPKLDSSADEKPAIVLASAKAPAEEQKPPSTPTTMTPATPQEAGNDLKTPATATSSARSLASSSRDGGADTGSGKKPKKHLLDTSDDNKTKSPKKPRVDSDSAPAASAKKAAPAKATAAASLKPNLELPKPKNYHEQRVQEMLDDPLDFDDLVHEDKRPMNKRPKFRRLGFRYKKPAPNFSPMVSGGLGDLPEEKPEKLTRKNGNNKKEHSREQSLSERVLKKNHHGKVAERVSKAKAQKNSLDSLTEKSKYSVNKEARYGNGHSISAQKKKIGGTSLYARQRQQLIRSKYSVLKYSAEVLTREEEEETVTEEPTMTRRRPVDLDNASFDDNRRMHNSKSQDSNDHKQDKAPNYTSSDSDKRNALKQTSKGMTVSQQFRNKFGAPRTM